MDEYMHYIRIANGIIVHGFSDAFEQPKEGDIQLPGDFGRHFQMNLRTDRGQYKYKWIDSELVERTQSELDAELALLPSVITLEERIRALEDIQLEQMLGGL